VLTLEQGCGATESGAAEETALGCRFSFARDHHSAPKERLSTEGWVAGCCQTLSCWKASRVATRLRPACLHCQSANRDLPVPAEVEGESGCGLILQPSRHSTNYMYSKETCMMVVMITSPVDRCVASFFELQIV
jgi:hypothetical protein